MHIVLATGIYPPDIGGIATYAENLAREFKVLGHTITVITYGQTEIDGVVTVSRKGNMISRWMRYSKALHRHAADADIVIAFSSVSVGVPLLLTRLQKPKKILRLGGDFFWERYTDHGGTLGLRAWYKQSVGFWKMVNALFMPFILRSFHRIVYSTDFQEKMHEEMYPKLPAHTVIQNAIPAASPMHHTLHMPFRILSMGRFVAFKNLLALIDAIALLPDVRCIFVGSGGMERTLRSHVIALSLEHRVQFMLPISGADAHRLFAEHDLLVIPSTTEISPNAALEARAAGLPVLLTKETGLSTVLTEGMTVAELKTPAEIAESITSVAAGYDVIAGKAARPALDRSWQRVAADWNAFLTSGL